MLHQRRINITLFSLFLAHASAVTLTGCVSRHGEEHLVAPTAPIKAAYQEIKINQAGYYPERSKVAIIPASGTTPFSIKNLHTQQVVFEGVSSAALAWDLADETASTADFSALKTPGLYQITTADGLQSPRFRIFAQALQQPHDMAIKAYYFNRASSALDMAFAGQWQRAAGHPDDHIVPLSQPAAKPFASSKGWYDAGDYNKYIVNSGISTYTLIRALKDFPAFYANRQWNIPESINQLPDMQDEISWNLDWMLSMQASDGGVYHKLTTKNFAGPVMPHEATAQRFVTAKSTAATLNFAAVMAAASTLDTLPDPALKQRYLRSAKMAWQWAQDNPKVYYTNEKSVHTGEYGDDEVSDEFAWAGAQLYVATGNKGYLQAFLTHERKLSAPSWSQVYPHAYLTLLNEGRAMLTPDEAQAIENTLINYARELVEQSHDSAYQIPARAEDFVWGSNAVLLNKAVLLWTAWKLTHENDFNVLAQRINDYIFGQNPTGYSYVTGVGTRPPQHIHHRPSYADEVVPPVPGFVAGGPQNGHQDGCNYYSKAPARSYIDDWCSYSTNEVTINWNAPLVYSLAAELDSRTR
ncbi:glycoside hydrolase family 9 protein [Salinimonas sediminis]|nr:glycoside hydrolase family 9 protein [Salinimonas sediminis]